MDLTLWLSFVGTVLMLALTPGPSVLLATGNSLKYGPAKTWGTILGDLSANLLQIILASLGLATIVLSSGEVFQAIKWLGVAYLIFLGVRKFFSKADLKINEINKRSRSFLQLYTEGFLMSAANPKAIVFFAALFPAFISTEIDLVPQIIALALTFLCIDCLSLLLYTHFAGLLKKQLENRKKVKLQNKIVGLLLILSGLFLSTIRRSQ